MQSNIKSEDGRTLLCADLRAKQKMGTAVRNRITPFAVLSLIILTLNLVSLHLQLIKGSNNTLTPSLYYCTHNVLFAIQTFLITVIYWKRIYVIISQIHHMFVSDKIISLQPYWFAFSLLKHFYLLPPSICKSQTVADLFFLWLSRLKAPAITQ